MGTMQRYIRTFLLSLACALGVEASARASNALTEEEMANPKFPPDAIVGEWWTEAEEGRPSAKVRFTPAKDGTYTGVLVWSPKPTKDIHNKNPKLRDRSVVGIVLMWNLRYEAGEYVDGYIYNPEDGGTYRMKAHLTTADSLALRGYMGIALFGQTQTWSRDPTP